MSFTFQIITYGCKVNQYESQAIREYWQSLGAREIFSSEDKDIDLFLLSGCAVTAEAISDARQMVRKLERDFPVSKVIVTGCAAAAEPQDFQHNNVIACIAQQAKNNLLNFNPLQLPEQLVEEKNNYPEFEIKNFERSRPILKIQDGCSHACTYCIVPLTRGKSRSRNPNSSLAELGDLFTSGFREVVISGINLRQYYAEKENFWGFLRRIQKQFGSKWQGKARLRLSSLEPKQLNNEALETLEECTLICPHLHLSLQSGSKSVLKRMGREHYSPHEIVETTNKLKTFWPRFALGADILMGFPAESEEEVLETIEMINVLPLTYAHVFPYSSRPNTKAAAMDGHLPKKLKQEHAARIRTLIEQKKKDFLQSMLELEQMHISLDLGDKNMGWNEYYVSCYLPNAAQSHELQAVKAIGIENDKLITKLL